MNDPQATPGADGRGADGRDADDRDADFQAAYPRLLRDREHDLLRRRREDAKLPASDPMVGVGLSGGGIRSATFALGLFQGLARPREDSRRGWKRRGLLRHVDYLSTVSGGGYFGSFFGQLLNRTYVESADDVEDILLGRKEERVLGFLRDNGRYLSPNGGGDALLSGSAVLRNWISIHVVLVLFLLAFFLGLQLLRTGLGFAEIGPEPDALLWLSPLLWLPLVTFVLGAVPLGWAYWLVEPERRAIAEGEGSGTAEREVSAISPVAPPLLVFVVSSLLAAFTWDKPGYFVLWVSLALIALLAWCFLRLAEWRLPDKRSMEAAQERDWKVRLSIYRNHGVRNRLGIWVTGWLAITGLLLLVALVDSLGQSVYAVVMGDGTLGAWLAAAFGSLGVLAGFGRWIAMFFSRGPQDSRPSLPVSLLAGVAALLIVLLILVSIDAGSHAIAFGLRAPEGAPARLLEAKKDERTYAVDLLRGPGVALDLRVCAGRTEHCRPEPIPTGRRNAMLAFLGFASALLLSVLFGQTWPFVNQSSHLPLYAARLTRAYLGASNPRRWNGTNITEPVEGDDSDLSRYWPPPSHNGAPIHLINVTINETIDGQSQVQQQDRKGLGLALGPWGLSAGIRHHIVVPLGDKEKMKVPEGAPIHGIFPERKPESEEFRVFDYPESFTGEALPLGTWLSISGAAFSTGTGMRTSLGLSLLAGLANVRLGRWWDSGVVRRPPAKRLARRKISLRIEDALARLFPVQTYLLDEFLARFPGAARRHWYLSDGGHFENMGGYELLRRRLPLILIVDGEMDADFTYGGLANLVRKARVDFGAEVRFLTEEQLDEAVADEVRPYIGTLAQLRRGRWRDTLEDESRPHGRLEEPGRDGYSLAHAALARVTYASDPDPKAYSWLLYVKPTLTGREPVDVLEYHAAHPIFPHEPTIDQFFDEAQWESYRRLGEYIADVLFGRIDRLVPGGAGRGATLLRNWDWKPELTSEDAEEAQVPGDVKALKAPARGARRLPRYS